MKMTYYGHASFGVEAAGHRLLFDPFIRPNPLARTVEVGRIAADYILVSHGHVDHLADAVEIARHTGATIISNYEISEWLHKKGAPKVHGMNIGGTWNFDFGRVKMVTAVHSSTLPDGSSGGCAGGFVVETSEGSFYDSGDTGLTYDMKLIGESFDLKFAVFNLGDNFTMGIEDAIKAADFVRCRKVVGIHFDTFPPIQMDREGALHKFQAAGLELVLIPIGETRELA